MPKRTYSDDELLRHCLYFRAGGGGDHFEALCGLVEDVVQRDYRWYWHRGSSHHPHETEEGRELLGVGAVGHDAENTAGLWIAIHKCKREYGAAAFRKFAEEHIRGAIRAFLRERRDLIRLPKHVHDHLSQLHRAREACLAEGMKPTPQELGRRMRESMAAEEVEELVQLEERRSTASLTDPLGPECSDTLEDTVLDQDAGASDEVRRAVDALAAVDALGELRRRGGKHAFWAWVVKMKTIAGHTWDEIEHMAPQKARDFGLTRVPDVRYAYEKGIRCIQEHLGSQGVSPSARRLPVVPGTGPPNACLATPFPRGDTQ